jgi:hypothetical protein
VNSGIQLKKNTGRESQWAWRQDELIGGKSPIRTVTITLTLSWLELSVEELSSVQLVM